MNIRKRAIPSWVTGLGGLVVLVGVWWILALTVFGPRGSGNYAPIPTPPQVVEALFTDGFAYYWRSFSVTITEAGIGYLWGNGIALVLSAIVLVLPWLEGVLNQIAVITYCIPIVAIGPLVLIVLGGASAPGEPSSTAVFLAAFSVFFTTVVGTLLGLKAADKSSLDVVTVYGGSKFTQLRKVRVIAALPGILNSLQIAVPAAFLGAVLGEYFGKIDVGVGPILVGAAVTLNSPRVWVIFLLCALVAIIGYALLGLVARLIAPWSTGKAA
jgi:ABC-type nitrate/sulfonate/bicarbonate transport system permease component